MTEQNPLEMTWRADQVEVMHRLRDWAVSFTELNQGLAAWMSLPTSDANALGHIVWAAESDAPLAPAELARRIGMTTGATTLLLHRLEGAGHITRSRESSDRRRVTLRPTASALDTTRAFLAVAGREFADTISGADPDELRVITGFLERMTAASDAGARRLAAAPRDGGAR